MPGESFAGPLPPLTERQAELEARLRQHVRTLAVPRNLVHYQALEQARAYLESQLQLERLPFEAEGLRFYNLETRCEGPCVVVGAHYDSVYDIPGANDNASGVAAVLELARLLAGVPGLRFVLFPNEEQPFYNGPDMGSAHYVRTRLAGVKAMICLETVGYYSEARGSQKSPFPGISDVGNFVCMVANHASTSLLQRLIGEWRSLPVPFPTLALAPLPQAEPLLLEAGIGLSDHANFWAAGIPALMVTDTVFYRYQHYHELSDTWDKLTYEPFARMVDGLAQVLARVVPSLLTSPL